MQEPRQLKQQMQVVVIADPVGASLSHTEYIAAGSA